MQTPSPTGALGALPFYALGWRRMGKETDSLRMRYLDKVRKMREKRNKKLGGVRKFSTLKPKVAPATPMETSQGEAPTSKYNLTEQLLLNRLRITPETFAPDAEERWKALWPQSLGPGLEEEEAVMRSFHLPNGDVKLYIQEYDRDASDEMVQVQLWVNLCYLMCKDGSEKLTNRWAEVEAAYAEYLQKVASASGSKAVAMDVQATAPTSAKTTAPGILPVGPVWENRDGRGDGFLSRHEALVDGISGTLLHAVKGIAVGTATTYVSGYGVAALMGTGLMLPGAVGMITGVGVTLLAGVGVNVGINLVTKFATVAAASLPDWMTINSSGPAGTALEVMPNLALRMHEMDLASYDLAYTAVAKGQARDLLMFMIGDDPRAAAALGPEAIIANENALLGGLRWASMSTAQQRAYRTGTAKIPVDKIVNRFKQYHILPRERLSPTSSLLATGQEAVVNEMPLVSETNDFYWCRESREAYVREVQQLKAQEGAATGPLPKRPARTYASFLAAHTASGFIQQRWAKQKLTVDYLTSMLGEEKQLELEESIADAEAKLNEAADEEEKARARHAQAYLNAEPAATLRYLQLQWNRQKRETFLILGKVNRLRNKSTKMVARAATFIKNRLCAVSSKHIEDYIKSGEESDPRVGIIRAHTLEGMARPGGRNAPPRLGAQYHVAAHYEAPLRGQLGRFMAYVTNTAEHERRTIRYYFESVLAKEAEAQLELLVPKGGNGERDFSAVGGWLGMNPMGDVRGELLKFYKMVERFNAEKTRLIDNRLLALLPGESPTAVFADRAGLERNKGLRPCNPNLEDEPVAAAPNGAVSVVDAAFARMAV